MLKPRMVSVIGGDAPDISHVLPTGENPVLHLQGGGVGLRLFQFLCPIGQIGFGLLQLLLAVSQVRLGLVQVLLAVGDLLSGGLQLTGGCLQGPGGGAQLAPLPPGSSEWQPSKVRPFRPWRRLRSAPE